MTRLETRSLIPAILFVLTTTYTLLNMYWKTLLGAAVLSAGIANADFMVYTEPPIPTSEIPATAVSFLELVPFCNV